MFACAHQCLDSQHQPLTPLEEQQRVSNSQQSQQPLSILHTEPPTSCQSTYISLCRRSLCPGSWTACTAQSSLGQPEVQPWCAEVAVLVRQSCECCALTAKKEVCCRREGLRRLGSKGFLVAHTMNLISMDGSKGKRRSPWTLGGVAECERGPQNSRS